ncbi:MAG: choloylglycine hydrolase family protein [Rhodobacteraceae bacterium]|nr:choloylglycine hydrolase family protein [Paracoccaceae bacterium]
MNSSKPMQSVFPKFKALVAGVVMMAFGAQSVLACTGIVIRALDGTVVPARTMEFGFDPQSNIIAVPVGSKIKTLALNPEETGFTFETKYGFVGADALGKPIIVDGLNTEGLYFGAFYFIGDAIYAELTDSNRDHAVSAEELGNWILGQFATVKEVREALPTIQVVGTVIKEIGGEVPFHYAVADASGEAIVIEYTKDGLTIHDNTVNAITNNPPYDWHLTNLRGYIGLQAQNYEKVKVGQLTLTPYGQGTGMVGLPGDSTSPSRFVRAVAFVNSSLPSVDSDEAVFNAFHILNTFDIPKGSVRDGEGKDTANDYTVWTSAADTRNVHYYYKTYKTQAVEGIDVRAAVAALTKPARIVMENGFSIRDRTGDF